MKAFLAFWTASICMALLFSFALVAHGATSSSGLAGKTLMPREIAAGSHVYWQNYELTKAIAVALAESAGSLGAWHDNLDDLGVLSSRDCGLYQINIPVDQINTSAESDLRTISLDPAEYTTVWQTNTRRAFALYSQPWSGRPQRLWQPWVAYTTGWATFPQWWVWHQQADGTPVGPWLPTGRYIQRAIAGQMNYHVVIAKDWTATTALSYAHRYAQHFSVLDTMYVNSQGIIAWHFPPKPTDPPANGVGPRPVPNDGA